MPSPNQPRRARRQPGLGVGGRWQARWRDERSAMSVQITDQRRYPPGVPCWVDVAQPDPSAAALFYGELFGWALTEVMPPDAPGSYLVATLGGHDVAAVGLKDCDAPPAWRAYLASAGAYATGESVLRAGGSVVWGPEDVVPAGRTATCAD